MFLFEVPKHTALKIAKKRNYVLQKPFSTQTSLNFSLVQKISKNDEKEQEIAHLGSKTPKNDLLTFNYGLPSSSNTLGT